MIKQGYGAWGWIGALAATTLLSACNGGVHPLLRNESAYDAVQAEMARAKAQKAPLPEVINEALLPPLMLDIPVVGKPVEPRFDLAVSGAPAGQVFLAIVSGTRYSMILPPDLTGALTINLKNVTVREALESIRDIYGYEFSVQGNRISIQPNTIQTRLFQISYLAAKRGGGSATRVNASNSAASGAPGAPGGGGSAAGAGALAGSGPAEATAVFTGQSSDFWFDLAHAVAISLNCEYEVQRATGTIGSAGSAALAQAMNQRLDRMKCPDGRNFVVNQQSGVVMVRAMPGELREIGRLLKAMQASVERQVMIEAKILEVELSEGFQSGINWASFNKNGGHRWSNNGATDNYAFPGGRPLEGATDIAGNTVATLTGAAGILKTLPGSAAIGLAFQTNNFAAIINFLQTQGNVYVMSSPRIATLNNQKAVLKVGSDDYFVTSVTPPSYTNASNGGAPTVNPPTITTQPFFSGVSLDVTPQIDENGSITLHVRPAVSEVTEKPKTIEFGDTLGKYVLPYASTKVKETDSIVKVRDGMIVAIGGLMSQSAADTNSRVPGLGDVPVAGSLFKQNGVTRGKREMVILLKPTVIHDDSDWQADIDATGDRLRAYDPRLNPVSDMLKPR